jgi:uroporphyrinogen-III decarboxylase
MLPPLVGIASFEDAAKPGVPVEDCVRRLKRFHYSLWRIHQICIAHNASEPLYELKMAFSMHAHLAAEIDTLFRARVGEYSIMGWVEGPAAEATDLRRMDNFFMDLMDDEGYSAGLMDLCVDVALDFAKPQIESGADTIGIGDAAASQLSVDIYERLVLPREQRLVRGLKENLRV